MTPNIKPVVHLGAVDDLRARIAALTVAVKAFEASEPQVRKRIRRRELAEARDRQWLTAETEANEARRELLRRLVPEFWRLERLASAVAEGASGLDGSEGPGVVSVAPMVIGESPQATGRSPGIGVRGEALGHC